MMHRNKLGLTKICPLCEKEVEDWAHVFKCQSQCARVERGIQLGELRKALQVRKTNTILMQRLMALLSQWTSSYKLTIPSSDGDLKKLNLAFEDQRMLGVENMFAGVLTHKFGDIQEKHYEQMTTKATRYTKKEWNAHVVRSLLKYGEAIWKNRCTYLHEESKLTMEHQTREMALKLRNNLIQHPWKLRIADKGLMRRKKSFFEKAHVRNLNGWIERILISINITEQNENALRQDIRKWMILPESGYTKIIKYPAPIIVRKYEQLTLKRCFKEKNELNPQILNNVNAPIRINNSNMRCQSAQICYSPLHENDSCYSPTSLDAMEYEIVVDENVNWNLGFQNIIEEEDKNNILNSKQANETPHVEITPIPSVIERRYGSSDDDTFYDEMNCWCFFGPSTCMVH